MSLHTAVAGFVATFLFVQIADAVTLGQRDSFQLPGEAGWTVGNPVDHPRPPVWIINGGPTGTGDHFLQVQGFGGTGAGRKPNTFNASQWAGNYLSVGVTAIELDVKYLGQGPETMQLRIGLEGPDGFTWSLRAEEVGPGTQSPWQHVEFPIDPANLGGGNPLAVLSNVSKLWLYHAPVGDTPRNSPSLDVRVGYDNIVAPLPDLLGDANLDGVVDDTDFGILQDHLFTESPLWPDGDFNQDGVVDVSDFNIWNDHKSSSSNVADPVPEPAAQQILAIGLMAIACVVRVR